jgi:pyruvate dehydrogenase E1 component
MAAVPEQILGSAGKQDADPGETQEWLQALDGVIRNEGPERAAYLIDQQISHARVNGVNQPFQ